MSRRPWEVGDLAAILTNPFYAIEIHASLSRPHAYALTESQWIKSNEKAIQELGPRPWLKHLITALKVDHRGWDWSASLPVADPYPAITIHPTLCLEHEPIIEEARWIEANIRGLHEGEQVYLRNLLSVLKGAYLAID